MKISVPLILTLPLIFLCFCVHPLKEIENVIYNPCVVFVGYVSNDYDSLPGNLSYPNTCEILHGDTLRMHFYSESYTIEDRIWYGEQLILTLLPNANDSLISTRSVFLHFVRYGDVTSSYDVVPADSSDPSNNKAEMRALALSRTHGSRIDIDEISVVSTALIGGGNLTIDKGMIFGRIP